MPMLTSGDGTPIAYELVGAGPAVILIDGAMCFRDGGPMRAIAEALTGSLTAVLYDRRGRGESGDTLPFAVEREIEDIDALIDVVGGQAALFGISSGGALALRAAAALGPGRATALAVYEVPFMPPEALGGAAEYTRALGAALSAGQPEEAVAAFLRRVGTPEAGVRGARHSPGWPGMVAIAPTLAYDDAAMGDSTVPVDVAAGLGIPTLALVGGASPDFLSYGVRMLADVVPGARFEVVEGQDHDVAADAVAPHLLRFFGVTA